jgi:hypothetical protein
MAGIASSPAGAQAVSDQAFGGYGSGATASINVLQLGQTQALNVQAAAAGQSTNSRGLPATGLFNEFGYVVQPDSLSANSYGRGTGLELGLLTPVPNPDPNQILLAGLAQAQAPPDSGLITKQIGPIKLGGVAFANLLRGQAQAIWDPNTCAIGKPYSFGQGEATALQLLGTPDPNTGELTLPLVGALLPPGTPDPNNRNVSRTRSFTYLIPNGDGTFGVVSETRQTIAPVTLAGGAITLELLGEWALRAIATGKPGGARVEYAPVGAGPTTPVLTLTIGTSSVTLTTQQLFGPGGFNTASILGALSAVLQLTVGTPARALGGTGAPAVATDGTSASAASDVVTLNVLNLPGLAGAKVAIGHMEAAAVAPPGGVRCNIPVAKVGTPDPVTVGQDFTITIRIPSDAALFERLFGCDLIGIKAVDVHTTESGNATFTLTGADHGGVLSGDGRTVTFENLGDYHIGDPPLELHVFGHIPGNSGAGVLKDTVDVQASLGNCTGTGAGEDVVGRAIGGGAVIGTFTLIGPEVSRAGALAATGGDERLLLLGGVFLLGALGVRRRLRRPARTT